METREGAWKQGGWRRGQVRKRKEDYGKRGQTLFHHTSSVSNRRLVVRVSDQQTKGSVHPNEGAQSPKIFPAMCYERFVCGDIG